MGMVKSLLRDEYIFCHFCGEETYHNYDGVTWNCWKAECSEAKDRLRQTIRENIFTGYLKNKQ